MTYEEFLSISESYNDYESFDAMFKMGHDIMDMAISKLPADSYCECERLWEHSLLLRMVNGEIKKAESYYYIALTYNKISCYFDPHNEEACQLYRKAGKIMKSAGVIFRKNAEEEFENKLRNIKNADVVFHAALNGYDFESNSL